jgi:hypothetical protein
LGGCLTSAYYLIGNRFAGWAVTSSDFVAAR